jgi:hypothetical protein
MEETLAGLVAEVERLVRPLGFYVNNVYRKNSTPPIFPGTPGTGSMEKEAADNAELVVGIIRKGRLG